MYLWNGWVHIRDTQRPLEVNTGRGGMKRIMEDVVAWHVKAIHYLASVKIGVGREKNIS